MTNSKENMVFIIAEAGVNHNGRLDLALELCDAAKKAGVDAIKFQTFKTELVLTRTVPMAEYQAENVGGGKTQFEMVKELELGYEDFRSIKQHCEALGVQFISTPDEEDSLDFLVDELGMMIVKVGSGEVTNIPYLRAIGKKRLPVILSTGMSTLGEVEKAIQELRGAGAPEISLLHCTTNYPCPMDEVNLNAMLTMREAFKTRVGYSDHTSGIEIAIAAVALGANIIEKHFTLSRQMPGPDHVASLEPQEIAEMVEAIRHVETARGSGIKGPTKSEEKLKKVVRRSLVALRQIEAGEVYIEANIGTKRSGGAGIPSELWDSVIGRKAPRTFAADEAIEL